MIRDRKSNAHLRLRRGLAASIYGDSSLVAALRRAVALITIVTSAPAIVLVSFIVGYHHGYEQASTDQCPFTQTFPATPRHYFYGPLPPNWLQVSPPIRPQVTETKP